MSKIQENNKDISQNQVALGILEIFSDLLKHNGDVIQKNFQNLLLSLDEIVERNSDSNNDILNNRNFKNSSFSSLLIGENENKEQSFMLNFSKPELQKDEKIKFIKTIQSLKHKFNMKHKKSSKISRNNNVRSFNRPISQPYDLAISFLGEEEFENMEEKLKILIFFCQKNEKDNLKSLYSLWNELSSPKNLLGSLGQTLDESIKNQEALVNLFIIFSIDFFYKKE